MDIAYFEKLWRHDEADLNEQKQHWDIRADEFNQYRSQTSNDKARQLMDYLKERGLSLDGMHILDIGCGTGHFALELAAVAASVTGLDISTKMIEYANRNAAQQRIGNVEFLELPWEEIDLAANGWLKKFDLVIAHMTPAIGSRQSLEKMNDASKRYCFMSGYVERYEQVMTDIAKKLRPKRVGEGDGDAYHTHGLAVYCAFNILWLSGIYPEMAYQVFTRENKRSIDEAMTYYGAHFEFNGPLPREQQETMRRYLESITVDGTVNDIYRSKTAWMLWKP